MNELELFQLASRGTVYGVWTLVLIAVVTLIRGWPALRKLAIEADGSLRSDLLGRIRELEQLLRQEQAARAQADALVRGLERQLIQLQLSAGIAVHLTSDPDPEQEKLLDRLRDEP